MNRWYVYNLMSWWNQRKQHHLLNVKTITLKTNCLRELPRLAPPFLRQFLPELYSLHQVATRNKRRRCFEEPVQVKSNGDSEQERIQGSIHSNGFCVSDSSPLLLRVISCASEIPRRTLVTSIWMETLSGVIIRLELFCNCTRTVITPRDIEFSGNNNFFRVSVIFVSFAEFLPVLIHPKTYLNELEMGYRPCAIKNLRRAYTV